MKGFKVIAILVVSLALQSNAQQSDGVGLVIGGWNGGTSLEVITSSTTCIDYAANPPLPNAPAGNLEGWVAEYVDNQVFLCGGSDLNNQAECYSLPLQNGNVGFWSDSGRLANAREYPATLVFNGEMVVMGGYSSGAGWIPGVEKKFAGNGTWQYMFDWVMEQGVFDFCAVQSSSNGIIIAGGNIYDNGNKYTDAVRSLNTDTGVWSDLTPLPSEMSLHHCMRYDLNGDPGIILTGGCPYPCSEHYSATWFYSFAQNNWQPLADLNQSRFGHKMTWIDGKPAVVGGYDTSNIGTIETFDGQSWTLMSQTLSFPRWAYGMPSYLPPSAVTC